MAIVVTLIALLIAFVVAGNLYATTFVLRSRTTSQMQKFGQIAIIWLLPIIGSRLIIYLLSEQELQSAPRKLLRSPTANYWALSILGAPARELTGFAIRSIFSPVEKAEKPRECAEFRSSGPAASRADINEVGGPD